MPTSPLLAQIQSLEQTFAYRNSFREFVKGAWSIIEPNTEFVPGWHIDAICDHLEALHKGHIKKLCVAMPPRHMKSTLISVCYPAWVWLHFPNERFLCASYALSLSLRDSTRCRALIDSDWYQERWGDVFQWLGDQNVKVRYENSAKGYRIATSVEGAATGEGGSCVSGDTKVQTEQGELAIQAIVDRRLRINVLTYNHTTDVLEYKPIEKFSKIAGKKCVQVTCENGNKIECSDDHPFYTQRGYIQAKYLQVGDTVYASGMRKVRRSVPQKTTRDTAVAASFLQQSVLRPVEGRTTTGYDSLRSMWQSCLQAASAYGTQHESSCMQSQVLWDVAARREQSSIQRWAQDKRKARKNKVTCDNALFGVWGRDRDLSERHWQEEVLQSFVCGCITSEVYGWGKQPELRRWWLGVTPSPISKKFPKSSYSSARARQTPMSYVFQDRRREWSEIGCASHRLRQEQQRDGQFDSVVQALPQQDTEQRADVRRMEATTVVSVEQRSSLPYVYNLQVKDNHNYFVNGILSHNCLIVDDPHNIQEGESDMVRQATLDWFDRVFVSRLNDQRSGKMVVIGQRVHEQDLIGHLIESGDWEYLMLPAEYIPSKKTRTCIGWKDPRKKEGEVLWKTKFPKSVLTYLKKTLGIHYYSQYQQSPVRDQGNIFKSQYFLTYSDRDTHYLLHKPDSDELIAKIHCRTVFSTDLAVSTKSEADYTVVLQWAVTPDLRFLLTDIIHDRLEAPESEELIWSHAVASKRLWGVIIEDVAYQKSTIQRLRRGIRVHDIDGQRMRKGIPVIPYRPMADKVSRAQSMVVWLKSGNFFFNPNITGFVDYKKELLGFPRAGHDDYVDATTITQALFEFGEPAMTSVNEEMMLAQELEAIREIEKSDPDLADFLLDDMDFEKKEWWEVYS